MCECVSVWESVFWSIVCLSVGVSGFVSVWVYGFVSVYRGAYVCDCVSE